MSVVKSKDETEFIVLKIHETKKEGGKTLYLVEWDGYPSEKDYSWEPYKNLKNCIIFEDDVIPKTNYEMIIKYLDNIPKNYDIA